MDQPRKLSKTPISGISVYRHHSRRELFYLSSISGRGKESLRCPNRWRRRRIQAGFQHWCLRVLLSSYLEWWYKCFCSLFRYSIDDDSHRKLWPCVGICHFFCGVFAASSTRILYRNEMSKVTVSKFVSVESQKKSHFYQDYGVGP